MIKYNYFNSVDYPFYVTKETVDVTPYTFGRNGQIWETESMKIFFSYIDPNNEYNIVDIGAQSGSYTLFAKYLPKSTFYSFEPFNKTFELLNDNIRLNNIDNVKTFNFAISDTSGTSILNTSIGHNGLHTLGANPLRFNDISKVSVETKTIDELFYDRDIPIHYIKIDTEGWEFNIIKGARKTLNKYKPLVQLEWVPTNMKQCDVNPNELEDLLKSLNYKEVCYTNEEKIFI